MIVFYDASVNLIYAERTQRVWPARSLVAMPSSSDDTITIAMVMSLVPVLGPLPPSMVQRADGTGFTDQVSAMAYLQGEFSRFPIHAPQSYGVAIVVFGQTVIPISPAPNDVNSLGLSVNGASYFAPDIAVSPSAVTWQGAFPLDPSDALRVTYF